MGSESPHSSGFAFYHLLTYISVTLKPTSICGGKWLANSHNLWCRKMPASFPASKPSRRPSDEVVFTTHMIFFFCTLPLWRHPFTHGLKGRGGGKKRRRKCKEKENLPEMKNSNLAFVKIPQAQWAAPPHWSRPLCFQARGWKPLSCCIENDFWQSSTVSWLGWISMTSLVSESRPSFTIEQLDCCLVAGQKQKNQSFFQSPVVPLTCQKVVTHPC